MGMGQASAWGMDRRRPLKYWRKVDAATRCSGPFCDGSHRRSGTGIKSLKFTVRETKTVPLCGCKQTSKAPYCDGTHRSEFVQNAPDPST
uniref:Iron-binding zinc finger CDGSH type domain-containing protein n=1 Tax=Eptatretus burgeri TaxID=7764 RepID=A0A8C4Q135_EPTBU